MRYSRKEVKYNNNDVIHFKIRVMTYKLNSNNLILASKIDLWTVRTPV